MAPSCSELPEIGSSDEASFLQSLVSVSSKGSDAAAHGAKEAAVKVITVSDQIVSHLPKHASVMDGIGLYVLAGVMVLFVIVGGVYVFWNARKERQQLTQDGFTIKTGLGSPLLSPYSRLLPAEFVGCAISQFLVGSSSFALSLAYTLLPAVQNKAAGVTNAAMQTPNPLFSGVTIGMTYTVLLVLCPGATMNPLMTIHYYYIKPDLQTRGGFFLFGGMIVAQLMGSIGGDALTYALLISSLRHYLPNPLTIESGTTGIFALAFPAPWVPNSTVILGIVLTSTIFVFVLHGICNATTREKESASSKFILIGILIVVMVAISGGTGLGSGFNPVQPLAGAIFMSLAGWPSEIWTHNDGFVWISTFAPFIGGILGLFACYIYDYAIMHGKGLVTTPRRAEPVTTTKRLEPLTTRRLAAPSPVRGHK